VIAIGVFVIAITRGRSPSSTDDVAATRPPPPAAPTPTPTPTPTVVTPKSPRAQTIATMHDALVQFSAWATAHPHVPCPRAAELGPSIDAWGTELRVTCKQLGNQRIGITSAGPDRAHDTADDIQSWLEPELINVAAGPRWTGK
jgi:hypothetical protein